MVETNRINWNKITKLHESEFNEQIQLARAGRPCLFFIPKGKNKKSAQGQTATSHFGSALASAQALRDEQQQLHQHQQQQQPQQPREAEAEACHRRAADAEAIPCRASTLRSCTRSKRTQPILHR